MFVVCCLLWFFCFSFGLINLASSLSVFSPTFTNNKITKLLSFSLFSQEGRRRKQNKKTKQNKKRETEREKENKDQINGERNIHFNHNSWPPCFCYYFKPQLRPTFILMHIPHLMSNNAYKHNFKHKNEQRFPVLLPPKLLRPLSTHLLPPKLLPTPSVLLTQATWNPLRTMSTKHKTTLNTQFLPLLLSLSLLFC